MKPRKQGGSAIVSPPFIPVFSACPAKTFEHPDGTTRPGRSVVAHCQIVGEVARALIACYPPALQTLFPVGAPMAAASHDIGKVSPFFFEKLRRAFSPDTHTFPALPGINPALEKEWGGHAGVSQITAQALHAPAYVPEILGQHHGFSPSLVGKKAHSEVFGGEAWHAQRVALVEELKTLLACDWPEVTSAAQARILAGLTSVADWIGSGQWFEDPHAATPWSSLVKTAVTEAGFTPFSVRSNLNFKDIFDFSPRTAQQQLIDAVSEPGVYVLEAPMGIGKTEAALFCAYQMLAAGKASGIYFALPTQLTSNKILERFNAFLARIISADDPRQALLLHSGAWLLETEMGEEGRPGGAWFNSAKRGLLAPFAVGTLDQALMAAMNVKHGFVRAFGLAGKVVILDEVHTYDAYTGTLLDALIQLLRDMQCTVIVLSATLSQERRQMLLNSTPHSQAYPLITALPTQGQVREYPVEGEASRRCLVRCITDDEAAMTEALQRAAEGQQVLWIENSVSDAQQRYLDMAARAAENGVLCGLLHSRFTANDRQQLEARWVNCFGKAGWPQRLQQGRILVGTQVLEQSLDIDADFLVSRFAPTDMLLQRLGRLWRHAETPRATNARPEAWWLAPATALAIENPPRALGASAYVYSPYVLCRSLEVWQPLAAVCLPDDIRPLIEQTYAPRTESGAMATWLHELDHGTRIRKGRRALRQLARITLAESGCNTLPESHAQTRYSESDTCEVLLLRAACVDHAQHVTLITLCDGRVLELPHQRQRLTRHAWRRLSAELMRHVVAVRFAHAPTALPINALEAFALQHCFYLGNPQQDESVLRVVFVDNEGVLRGVQGAKTHVRHTLEYRNDLGYRVIKGME